MEGIYGIVRALWQGIQHVLSAIWAGWQGLIDWITHVGLRQIGITIRETSDVIDYVSGVIAIVAAVLAVYRWWRPQPQRAKVVQAYQRLNAEVTQHIIALRHKNAVEADRCYNAFMATLHENKYLFDTKDRKALFDHWTPAKYEHQKLYPMIKNGTPDKINPVHLQALQIHIQQRLKSLE